jgi:hypothetical protein
MALQKKAIGRGAQKGQVRNPRGPKVGTKMKKTIRKEQIAAGLVHAGITPLEFMQNVMEAEDMPLTFKMDAAKNMFPYVHRKMPVAVEIVGGEDPLPVKVTIDFKDGRKKKLLPEKSQPNERK